MKDFQEFQQVIRKNGIAAFQAGQQVGLCCPLTDVALQKLHELVGEFQSHSYCILIGDISQLRDYVEEIPEIAWDIVEFEEGALIVEYPELRIYPPQPLMQNLKARIMLTKHQGLTKSLYNYGKGMLYLTGFDSSFLQLNLSQFDYVLNLPANAQDIMNPKLIKLELNGEIKFL